MILRIHRVVASTFIGLALLVSLAARAAEAPRNADPSSGLPDVPQCRGVLSQEIVDVVLVAEKDPRKALEKKRRKSNTVTKASVDCASKLWQALHPPAPKLTRAQRKAAARLARASEKAREASTKRKVSRPLTSAGTRESHEAREAEERSARAAADASVVYAGAPVDHRPVLAVFGPPLRNVPPIPPKKRGEGDKEEDEGHEEPVRPPSPSMIGGPDGFRQQFMGPVASAPTPTGVSFDGIGVGLVAFNPSSNPPDVNGHVGATQYVQWNNTSFAIFSKTGTLLYGPAAGNTLFQSLGGVCASQNDGDPVVNYDLLAGRWVLSQFVVGGSPGFSHQCFAVSATDDALGAYYLYDFVTDPTNFVDYPHVGVWPDGYYMTTHIFNSSGTAYLAARVHVFEREKMILGLPARQVQKDLRTDGGARQYGFLPADLDSTTPPPVGEASFVLGPNAQFTNQTDSTRVAVTWGVTPTITLTEATITTVGIGNAPCVNNTAAQDNRDCVPQPSPAVGADYLDNISDHFMYRLAYRNFGGSPVQESLVVSGPTNGSASSPAHGAVKWIEFRNAGNSTSTPTVFQSGTFDPDTSYRWLSSIAMDKDHNIALGYSKSSTSIKPGIYMTGRLEGDTINTMGAEATVHAGAGSQLGAANRWGDYSAMTLDPVDQCTFWYTNEYLKTDGSFSWSTRIASSRFPSCIDAPAWGTVSGTITSCANGAPIAGTLVTLSNGFAGSSDAAGHYSILVPAGTYNASAANAGRNCTSSSPSIVSVISTSGGTTTQDFCMTGTSNLQTDGFTIDDSVNGNNNGVVNRNECVNLNVALENAGCGNETAISAVLTTTTPNVTVTLVSSAYPNLSVDASGNNLTPLQFQTSNSFVCGTAINFTLNVAYASGNKVLNFSVPTCAGPNQTIPSSSLTAADLTQPDRLGRDGVPSTCAGKTSPGGGFPGTKFYKTFTFTNTSTATACFTVNITAALGGAGDIESAAYSPTYNPLALSTNYRGDSGIVGLGTTVGNASYAFTVPASANFVVVVNTTGTTTSSVFSGTVSGFVDGAAGPGGCPACTPPPTPTATPGGPTTFCQGDSVTLTSSSATDNQWYNGLALLAGQTGPTYIATTSGNYNVVVTTAGCQSAPSSSVAVTVNPSTPTITPGGPTTFCAAGSVTLTSSSATGNQWYLEGNPIGGETNQTYIANASGSYTVIVTAGICTSLPSAATTVTVNPIPATPTITEGGSTTFCEGGSVNLSSSSATGNQWSRNGTPIVGQTGQVHVATLAGSYTVTVTTNGCASAPSAPKVVTVNPKPNATITVVSPMFSGASSTASVNVACQGATFAWSITGGTITGGNGTPLITFTAGPAGTLMISVTVTGANGCSDSKSVNVTVQTAAFGAPPAFRATSSGTTSANLNWGSTQTTDHYEIHRSTDNIIYTLRGTSPTTTFSEGGLAPSTTYFYKVRAIKPDTTASAFSAIDPLTTFVFADDPISSCGVTIQAVHLTQLRTAVNIARASLSLPAFTFTDPSLAAGFVIKGVHLAELRSALLPVLTAIGVTPTYTDPTITGGTTPVKAAHIRELRNLIR